MPPERLHTEGQRLMQALLDLETCNANVRDSATSSDASVSEVAIDFLVSAETDSKAVECALNLCRTAIHAIGAGPRSRPERTTRPAPGRCPR